MKVLDVSARRTVAVFRADTRAAGYVVAFSRDRRLLALGCEDGAIKVLRTDPLGEVRALEAHAGEIAGMAFGAGDDNGESRCTGPYNLSGHPAVSLPVPAAGLPAGLQLAGRRGADAALLRVAAAAERLFAEQHQPVKA